MTSNYKSEEQKIYFFENFLEERNQNTLKEFLYFLKGIGHHKVSFSYAASIATLNTNLTIKENYILDAIPKSLIKDNENNLQDFLNNIDNPYLKELISKLDNLDQKVGSLPGNEKKIASLTKTILTQSDFIFLEKPEKDLSTQELLTLKKCILFEAKENNRHILISSTKNILWPGIVTNIVSRNKKYRFENDKNPLFDKNEFHSYSHKEELIIAPLKEVS